MMSNKRILLKKLLEYPSLNNEEYINLIHKKNNSINENELKEIDSRIDVYLEKNLIIDMIKISPSSPQFQSQSSFFLF